MSIYLEEKWKSKVPNGTDESVVSRAFWLWSYQIAYDQNQSQDPSPEQLAAVYANMIPVWGYIHDTLKSYFVNPEDFVDTRWHYELIRACYLEKDFNPILRRMRSHRYEYFCDPQYHKDHVTYKNILNTTEDIKTDLLPETYAINNMQIRKFLNKKWHKGVCQINFSAYKKLEALGLLDCITSYHELKTMLHYFENHENIHDMLLDYFAPTDTFVSMLKTLQKEPYIPAHFLTFVKDQKDNLSWQQYQSLLEYSLLLPNPNEFDFSKLAHPGILADAYHYASLCMQDDITELVKYTQDSTLKRYRMQCLVEDYIYYYIDIYYNCKTQNYSMAWISSYMQRLVNWLDDDLRWCYNHPFKAMTLLIVGLGLAVILELFAPVLMAAGAIASKLQLRTPAWFSAIGSASTLRGVGWVTRLIMGKKHPILHFANKTIHNSVHNGLRDLDFEKMVEDISKFKANSSNLNFKELKTR